VTSRAASPLAPEVTPARAGDEARLREALTVGGILRHERALDRIGKRFNNNRASGTKGFDASVDYVANLLENAGYDVQKQTFTYQVYTELAAPELERVKPRPRTFTAGTEFLTLDYSGSGNVSGRVVPTKDVLIPPPAAPGSTSGCEPADFLPAPGPGSIALIQRGTCTFFDKVTNAKAAGYAAVIVFNEGQAGRTDLFGGTLGAPVSIPAVSTSFAIGKELVEQARAGQVTARVETSTRTVPKKSNNLLANTTGGRADRIVLVGAHLDSVDEGPGINDNSSGVSTILEIALQLKRLNIKTRNRIRFAFWGAEESGLIGSTNYVARLSEADAAKIDLNLNFDMLGSPNFVRFVYDGDGSATGTAGPAGSDEIEEVFLDYFASRGLKTDPTAFDGRSDYGPFIAVGIPAGGLFSGAEGIKTAAQAKVYGGQAGKPYDACYHQACDTIENLSTKALDQLGDAVAHSVITFADRTAPIGPEAEADARVASVSSRMGNFLYRGSKLQR
jgi:Zn-dependent M28 family amino/carboxypeptidase